MGERLRETLVFGRGIDRYSGIMVSEPSSFQDLRNVHIQAGRVECRLGHLLRSSNSDDAILAIAPVRSAGVVGVVTLDGTDVKLYVAPNDLSSLTLVGTVWSSVATSAAFPRVICADANQILAICHDEPTYASRKVTRIWDVGAGTISDLGADLYAATDPPTLVDTYFRGVCRHLSTLWFWGYGSENSGDEDAPEYVRNGTALDPIDLKQQHYFIAGQRFEPVICCTPASGRADDENGVLLVFKESETFRISGSTRDDFTIESVEREIGCINARMAITVGGVAYFWSLQGPRRSNGGPSIDLALPLDLRGPAPSTLVTVASAANAFVAYHPDRREIVWHFGQWGYALSIADPERPEWSYREYGFEPNCASVVYQSAAAVSVPTSLAPQGYPEISACALTGSTDLEFTVDWNNIGTINGATDTAEVWARPASTGVWQRLANGIALSGLTGTATEDAPLYADSHEIAVRFVRNGVTSAAYSSSNPSDWPSISRFSGLITEWTGTPTISAPAWERISASEERLRFTVATAAVQANLPVSLEIKIGVGAWTPAGMNFNPASYAYYLIGVGEGEQDIQVRAVQSNSYQTGAPGNELTVWTGPSQIPAAVALASTGSDGYYNASWTPNGATDEFVELWTGKDSGTMTLNTPAPWNASPTEVIVGCPATTIELKARRKTTYFGISDYSDFSGIDSIAADCDGLV